MIRVQRSVYLIPATAAASGNRLASVMPGNGVDFKDGPEYRFPQKLVHAPVNLQPPHETREERVLEFSFVFCGNLCRTDVLGSPAPLRIEKEVLVGEIVKAALGNYDASGPTDAEPRSTSAPSSFSMVISA